ncbi:hypothetical protein GCM10011572_37030 [Pseudoduganella buxea]|uniref:Uncharacterized protein n=1 Tax=Pseudoduganella buxea TaxID=1949069 RepID=A0ABQ1KY66_9BURK|nr:hypothetical protein GCM10011572_37030 [Pseudoduganella buxea]
MGTDALGDGAMFGCHRLDPDILDAQFCQDHQGHQAGGKIRPDSHDGVRKISDAQLEHDVFICGIGLHGVGQPIGPDLDDFLLLIDTHDIMSKSDKRLRDCAAEAAEADHDNTVTCRKCKLLCKNSTQQLDAPLDNGRACAAR